MVLQTISRTRTFSSNTEKLIFLPFPTFSYAIEEARGCKTNFFSSLTLFNAISLINIVYSYRVFLTEILPTFVSNHLFCCGLSDPYPEGSKLISYVVRVPLYYYITTKSNWAAIETMQVETRTI